MKLTKIIKEMMIVKDLSAKSQLILRMELCWNKRKS